MLPFPYDALIPVTTGRSGSPLPDYRAIHVHLPSSQVAWLDQQAQGVMSRAAMIRYIIDEAMAADQAARS